MSRTKARAALHGTMAAQRRTAPEIVTKRNPATMIDVYAPSVSLLVKLGSIVVHMDEWVDKDGHEFDWQTARSLMADREVQNWIERATAIGLLPVKRNAP